MTGLSARWERVCYLLRRITESPPSFLAHKLAIEFAKRVEARRVASASKSGRSFSEGYEGRAVAAAELAAAIRLDVGSEIQDVLLRSQDREGLLRLLTADFDAGEWNCLGYGRLPLVPGQWHSDDLHGHTWKAEHFSRVDYVAAAEHCDVKIPWERSRMQWLVSVALAVTVDSESQRGRGRWSRALSLFRDWVAENPYSIGVNWVSSMEVAIRAVNVLVAFSLVEHMLADGDRALFLRTIGEHRRYIRKFPETSDVQGNHYLATELGALFLEAYRGDLECTRTVAQQFVAACKGQFSDAGLHVEFSPTYHRLSLDMLLVGRALLARVLPDCAAEVDELLARGLQICRQLSGTAELLPLIGDNDSGKVLDLGQSTRRFGYYGAYLSGADLRTHCSPAESMMAAVLRGMSGSQARTAPALPAQDKCSLRAAPFTSVQLGANKLVVKAGELGLAGRASHDHDDQLSFWYTVGAVDVIVEAGCPPYTLDREVREGAISSVAHNVISASGQERFRATVGSVCKTLRGGPRAQVIYGDEANDQNSPASNAGADDWDLTVQLLMPNGAAAEGCPSEHTRRFQLMRGETECLLIEDDFYLANSARFDSRLHLPPGAKVVDVCAGGASVLMEKAGLELQLFFESEVSLEIGIEAYMYFGEYGQAIASERLLVSGSAQESVLLKTRIEVIHKPAVASISREPVGERATEGCSIR